MKKLVFIVEDNIVQQKLLQVHFEETLGNYSVKIFTNPEDMLTHLKEKPFAIVLDHFFSAKNNKTGLHYLMELKKNKYAAPVIYYTTLDDESTRTKVMLLGAEQYIVKNSASLVRLRTALDKLHEKVRKKSLFRRVIHNLMNTVFQVD